MCFLQFEGEKKKENTSSALSEFFFPFASSYIFPQIGQINYSTTSYSTLNRIRVFK